MSTCLKGFLSGPWSSWLVMSVWTKVCEWRFLLQGEPGLTSKALTAMFSTFMPFDSNSERASTTEWLTSFWRPYNATRYCNNQSRYVFQVSHAYHAIAPRKPLSQSNLVWQHTHTKRRPSSPECRYRNWSSECTTASQLQSLAISWIAEEIARNFRGEKQVWPFASQNALQPPPYRYHKSKYRLLESGQAYGHNLQSFNVGGLTMKPSKKSLRANLTA